MAANLSLNASNFWVQFLAGVAVAGGGLWAVLRFLGHRIAGIAADKTGIKEVTERLDRIEAQYKHNGGGSLKDAIDRIERAMAGTADDIRALRRDLHRLEMDTAHIKGYLDGRDEA